MVLLISCTKEEPSNHFSAGILSTEVISHTIAKAVVRVRFFVYNATKDNGLVYFKGSDKLNIVYDSLKRITIPEQGNFSAAFIVSQGIDQDANMGNYFTNCEGIIRKLMYTCTPNNEIMFVKAGNQLHPTELISNGFIRDVSEIDQSIADIYKNGYYTATDTLSVLKTIDSTMNYMIANAAYENRHIFLMISRRKHFWQNVTMSTLINKAKQNNIKFHIIEDDYYYNTWSNLTFRKLLLNLNSGSHGLYYQNAIKEDIGNIPKLLNGGVECHEMSLTLNPTSSSLFTTGKTYEYEFTISLYTSQEKKEIEVPFNIYIE